MPAPLTADIATLLRTDSVAAMGALMIIAGAHRELLEWVAQTMPEARAQRAKRAKANGARTPKKDGYLGRRRDQRNEDDSNLVEAIKANPAGPIAAWAKAIHKSRTSCVSGLKRLRADGVAENSDGIWSLVGARAPREPVSRWIEPLRARSPREHTTA